MKKLYFRWKDEFCNGINPELIEMTGKEFLEFKRKPENKHRKFIECIDEYSETPTVVIEATQEKYDEWHREEKRKRRKKEEKKRRYKLVSMDAEIQSIEIGDITLHDVIPDESVNVEEDVSNS
jgi:DNA repair ATPase RecN